MKFEKVENLVTNLHDKNEYVILTRNLKQALNHELVLKKVNRMIKFNQNAQLKSYIDINTKLKQKSQNNFEKNFFKLMDNPGFRKPMENMRKNGDIKLITTEMRRNPLVLEPNYHTTKFFTKKYQ